MTDRYIGGKPIYKNKHGYILQGYQINRIQGTLDQRKLEKLGNIEKMQEKLDKMLNALMTLMTNKRL